MVRYHRDLCAFEQVGHTGESPREAAKLKLGSHQTFLRWGGSGPLSSSVGTTTGASPTPFAAAANAIPTAIEPSASSAVATTVSATAAPWTHRTKSRRADGAPRARGRSI
ncbi:hypothetical protein CF328_g9133 [Tilletia controversa]|nr:hypothetical protein CF328_g9133 [Tilletia controversa]